MRDVLSNISRAISTRIAEIRNGAEGYRLLEDDMPKRPNGDPSNRDAIKTHPLKQRQAAVQESDFLNKENRVEGQFRQSTNVAEKEKSFADLINKPRSSTTGLERKKLIPNNKALIKVLEEMLSGNIPDGRNEHHAAIRGHLQEQLTLRDVAGVPGVHVTNFSHIRSFDSVVPDEFTPSTLREIEEHVLLATLANARKPKLPAPFDAFTIEQFVSGLPPAQDPDIPDPQPSNTIQGRDLNGNRVHGLRAGHTGMADLMQTMGTTHLTTEFGTGSHESKHSWAVTAWMAVLLQVPPEKLEERLEQHPNLQWNLRTKIKSMLEIAASLQTFMRDKSNRSDHEKMCKEMDAARRKVSENMGRLTYALLASKQNLTGESLLDNPGKDAKHIATLMAALGLPCITMQHDGDASSTPHSVMYHSADNDNLDFDFGTANSGRQKGFFKDVMAAAPIVQISSNGFSLKLPVNIGMKESQETAGASPSTDAPANAGQAKPAATTADAQ